MKPQPAPIDPTHVRELALQVMAGDPFPHLATIDGDRPRVRPVSPVRTVEFTVYVANLRLYHKTIELAANPHVELCYLDEHHNQVRLSGIAEVLTDRDLIADIHASHNLLHQFLPDPFDANLIIYRITPHQVRYMQEWALEYYDVPLEHQP